LVVSSYQRLAEIVDCLLDPRVGIIQFAGELPIEAGAPNFFHFYAKVCNTEAFDPRKNFAAGGGASTERASALAKAIGEGVERYCSAQYDLEELPLYSWEKAPFRCVEPDAFALYGSAQYAAPGMLYVPFENTTPVRWAPTLDPLNEETWYVPAGMVFLPYVYYQGSDDAPIVQPVSTGLACHLSAQEAALSGLCEVVERDAFMITWQARLSAPHIRLDSLSDANLDRVERFQRAGATIMMLDITLDTGIPTILSVFRHPSPHAPPIGFATATALNPEDAVRKSLEELAHTRNYMQHITSWLPRLVTAPPEYENIVDQRTHLNFWCDHAHTALADFIFASSERKSFKDIPNLATGRPHEDVLLACRRIRAIGHQVLLADVTTEDVASLGLSVMRAVIPGFQPLQMGYAYRPLGGSRLWEIPQKLGYRGITRESGDNPVPHPFP
jgi:ribosomal protein S12 methylthiotransferase accessory factor